MSGRRTEHEGSDFVRHIACPDCGSKDNRAVFSDGHEFCFSFGCGAYKPASGNPQSPRSGKRPPLDLIQGEIEPLRARKITEETCRHFNYMKGEYKGQSVQIAPYYDAEGVMVGQKIRGKDKKFTVLGSLDTALPFGAQCWARTGKKIVVTEGEIDALTMSQVQGNKWPVVSIPNGAQSAKKFIAKQRDYFLGFDEVVLMFDMDEPGREAAKAAAEVLGSRARIATLPLKDPNEMLLQGKTAELINAMWKAEKFQPQGVVGLSSLREGIKQRPREGLSWPFETLTKLTYGIRTGELYALGAGTGVGKTDFFTQTMMHFVTVHKEKIGVISLEQSPGETGLRLAGKIAKIPLHVPDRWDEVEFDKAFDEITTGDEKVFLYDHFGSAEWDLIKARIEYLAHSEGIRYFFLDHLTALSADSDREAIDQIMADLGGLVKSLDVALIFISHLNTPEGKPHEEGGRVMIRHFRGSRSIGFWSHYMFGMERDQQADDPVLRQTTTFRILKDRYTGRATGEVFYLGYDSQTGMLAEVGAPTTADDHGFELEEPGAPADF